MNNNLEFENEDPSPDSIEDNHPRTNYGEGYYVKETLEEAAEDYIENTMKFSFNSLETKTHANRMLKCVKFGAKWQAERTEKEMQSAWEDGRNNVITVGKPPFVITKFQHNSFSNWFEKFKKK